MLTPLAKVSETETERIVPGGAEMPVRRKDQRRSFENAEVSKTPPLKTVKGVDDEEEIKRDPHRIPKSKKSSKEATGQ